MKKNSPSFSSIFSFTLSLLFFFSIFFPSSLAAPSQGSSFGEDIANVFTKYHSIGAAFAVAYQGEIIYELYYGYENKTHKIPVDDKTHIRVSSITKMVTAIGAMQLVEQEKMTLDEDISAYLGFEVYNPYYPDTPITVRQILTHTSTLNGPVSGTGKRSLEEIIGKGQHSKANFTNKKPGNTYQYSNFAYGVLGSIIEKVSGQNINTYMQQHVFAPLNIDASYHPAYLIDQEHLATTYEKGNVFKTGKAYLEGYSLFEDTLDPNHHYLITFGNLWIRAVDLTKLLMVLQGNGTYQSVRLLNESTIVAMRENQKGKGSVTGESIYGLGIERVSSLIPNRLVYGHQGMSRGMMANAYFDPETSLCFTLITNGSSQARKNTISLLARNLAPIAYSIAGITME